MVNEPLDYDMEARLWTRSERVVDDDIIKLAAEAADKILEY